MQFSNENIKSNDDSIISSINTPFSNNGGIKVLTGNLGTSVIKTSAVDQKNWYVKAPAVVIHDQNELSELFSKKELNKDLVLVVNYQGPKSNGMPELHQLTPILSILQHQGFRVALVTDGRMSGASGKVPAAIHLTPEAIDNGPISKIISGDVIELDPENGKLNLLIDEDVLNSRESIVPERVNYGSGTELFGNLRNLISSSQDGATFLNLK